ncbi:hypothetical protein K6V92_10515 [Cupriavidus respiraculi]|uniref:hypothetical protein n=1 Tax=Cupriavidus respiraculi TaxID=195930 RepID=UPI001C94ACD6|nr:hypothetical protein [Cupriavidus respiraculi]MBY4947051.1 hypothetical protein [Cupriavidus respiraculi]
MDQVTRKRMHKGLVEKFDRAVTKIEGMAVTPSMAMHPVGIIQINGQPYEVRVVLAPPSSEAFDGQDE